MEVNSFDLIGFDLFGVDLNSIDINTDSSVSVKDGYIPLVQNPYIKGHITTSDNTFTFSINNTDVTVNVDSNGNFKYKPTSTITSLSFVGVPQLESLELFKINGVTSFDVDYPTEVTFKKCDNTTISAKNDVYHIRGTATDDFQFTLRYIDDNNNQTLVTESAVIDENGKWDVSYSGKKIYNLNQTFYNNLKITSIEFTEKLSRLSYFNDTGYYQGTFHNSYNITSIKFAKGTTLNNLQTPANNTFRRVKALVSLDLSDAQLLGYGLGSDCFDDCENLETLNISSVTKWNNGLLDNDVKLTNLFVPQTANYNESLSFASNPLSYNSMLSVAGWLKNLTGLTAQTVTFKASTYNALTAEQKATLQGIIVTQKNWILATA